MKKILLQTKAGPSPVLAGFPTIMAGTVVNGQPDFVTIAWTGVAASSPPSITIALQHHRHSLKGIRQHMNFSVNIPSTDIVKETDYCGIASGASADKAQDCKFNVFYGKLPTAPFIQECPVNHACEVVQILNLGSHELIVGRIIETFVNEDCLTRGFVDPIKVRPFFFAGFGYYALGEKVGDAFRSGIAVNPASKLETLTELGIKKEEK
ncbi:MAG TPA: flavin reductase family protein [Dehalococcoidales bacterium]|nr:flavin reductase family protein [Dehalococcoidales bacterium]